MAGCMGKAKASHKGSIHLASGTKRKWLITQDGQYEGHSMNYDPEIQALETAVLRPASRTTHKG